MKTIKRINTEFVVIHPKVVIPTWVYKKLQSMYLPNCKYNGDKISFIITYHLQKHK